MSDNAQVGGAITAIYRRNMGTIIERWERHITAAGPDVAPGVPEEELARFRGRVSNPDNVRQFLERWEGEEGDVEEGLGEGEKGEGEVMIRMILRLLFLMMTTTMTTMMRMMK